MFVKQIKSYRNVVAICDENILGEKFEEENFQINVKENFYKGEICSERETIEIIKKMSQEDATFNIVGEDSIRTAIKAGIVNEENVGRISGIPFAFVFLQNFF